MCNKYVKRCGAKFMGFAIVPEEYQAPLHEIRTLIFDTYDEAWRAAGIISRALQVGIKNIVNA